MIRSKRLSGVGEVIKVTHLLGVFDHLFVQVKVVDSIRLLRAFILTRSGIAVGANKGHKVTPKAVAQQKKVGISQRTDFVRKLVREVTGLSPYERRIIELIRNSGEKRARKFAKKRLGTHTRAKAKLEEMQNVIQEAKRH